MSNMKIVSMLDHELRSARQVVIHDIEDALREVRSNINELQRATHKLRVDVDRLTQEGGNPG